MTAPIIILGAGGHGRVLLDTLLTLGHPVAGLTDADPARHGELVRGSPILGEDAILDHYPDHRFIVGIGDNRLRAKLFLRFSRTHQPAMAIHPTSV